ncbi:MAG: hypothetical protein AB1671_16535 [Thermodesulfobacteriota bacterium]|jgi:peroxiredoxin
MAPHETNGVLAAGTPAPNFRLPAAQGPEIALEEYRGRRNVVLWFSQGLY